jgi:peroxiredoxin
MMVAAKFHELDKNGDGVLTADEVDKPGWFKRLDADHDGKITMTEARDFFEKLAAAVPAAGIPKLPIPAATSPESAAAERPQEAPKRLKGAEYRIGALIPDLELQDLDGKAIRLSELSAKQPLIVAMADPGCPVSKRYLPTLAAMQKAQPATGAKFLLLSAASREDEPALKAALQSTAPEIRCVRDPEHRLALALGAKASTDAFLLDGARTLIYRGAIDDQYGLGYSLDAPRHQYLADALKATLAGHAPVIDATEAPGCLLDLGEAKTADDTAPTYHNRISRLVQNHCQECHRQGGVAPFPLETYTQVSAKAGMIRKMVDRRLMPPWFAAAPAPGTHSPWLNDRSLTDADRADLLSWIAAGKPEGNAAEAPLARQWPGEWEIGTPDAIVQIPKPLEVKATGTMPYIIQTVETGWTEDRWIRGFEVLPTARDVVHHVLVFAQVKGEHLRDGGNFLAAYVPGNNSVVYPDGFGKLLPANSKLIFQIHYTPNGTATQDQVRVGFLFAKEPPQHQVRVAEIANHRLLIPPNDANHDEVATIPVPQSVMVLGLMPHMHLRGKSFRYVATLPDGTQRTLLDVPKYDFNWQLAYRFAEPPILPAGTTVQATGWFDNSSGNPANPDPNAAVHWGPQTYDEMMLGYVEYCLVGEARRLSAR